MTIFVVFWCVGLAVDGGRAYSTNQRVAVASDAAALAGARGLRLEGLSVEQAKALTLRYFQQNFESMGGDYSQIQGIPLVTVDDKTGTVEIDVKAKVPAIFGAIGGIDNINIGKTAVAVFKQTDLEISMQLDMTGSMGSDSGSGTTKIDELKKATKNFVNILMPDVTTGQKVRIGFAPFDAGVNAGSLASTVDGKRGSFNDCIFERIDPALQTSDVAPDGANALMNANDVATPNCPVAQVVPMTDKKATLLAEIKKFDAGNSTAGHLGTVWAQYLLSPNWKDVWPTDSEPTAYKKSNVQKIALLMTDGDYNTFNSQYGDNNISTQAISSIAAAINTCKAMKDNGIIIYTVGFALSTEAVVTMTACASEPSKAYNVSNGDQLNSVFKNIANQITTLRLTQ
jgi:Flp pilus assembly protein TadG